MLIESVKKASRTSRRWMRSIENHNINGVAYDLTAIMEATAKIFKK